MSNSSRIDDKEYLKLALRAHAALSVILAGKGTFNNLSDIAQAFSIGGMVRRDGSFDEPIAAVERARIRFERIGKVGFDGVGLFAVKQAILEFDTILATTKRTELLRAIQELRNLDNTYVSVRIKKPEVRGAVNPPFQKKCALEQFSKVFKPIDGMNLSFVNG